MDIERFTEKAQDAIRPPTRSRCGTGSKHREQHLLAALLEQDGGVVPAVLKKANIDARGAATGRHRDVARLPKVSGTSEEPRVGSRSTARSSRPRTRRSNSRTTSSRRASATGAAGGSRQHRPPAEGRRRQPRPPAAGDQGGARQPARYHAEPRGELPVARALRPRPHAMARKDKLDPVIGRDEEIRRVIQVLSRRTKNNPVLIGEPGVGKTAVVEGLARRIVQAT